VSKIKTNPIFTIFKPKSKIPTYRKTKRYSPQKSTVMKKDEFTEEDLMKFFKKYDQGAKFPANEFEKIVFDTRFPQHLFENAKVKLEEIHAARERYKTVWQLRNENYKKQLKIAKEILKILRSGKEEQEANTVLVLENQLNELKVLLNTLEKELKEYEKKYSRSSKD
jgi:hypothetical protein